MSQSRQQLLHVWSQYHVQQAGAASRWRWTRCCTHSGALAQHAETLNMAYLCGHTHSRSARYVQATVDVNVLEWPREPDVHLPPLDEKGPHGCSLQRGSETATEREGVQRLCMARHQ